MYSPPRRTSIVEQRTVLVSAEHADLPIDVRLGGEYIHGEVHANAREVVRDAEERSQTEGDRVLVGQVAFGGELGVGVQGERVDRRGLVEHGLVRSVHGAGRGEDYPSAELLGEPFHESVV